MIEKQLQQGDVNINLIGENPRHITRKVDGTIIEDVNIFTKAKKLSTDIVREGETTGHAHRITGTDFRLYQLGSIILAEILSDDCAIVHEEHKTIELPRGNYQFSPVVEYDHFAERARFVRD